LPSKPGDLLNLRDVEQALDNLKRVPTADADIQIAPGERPGESALQLAWKQERRWRFSASMDDSGSDNTGKYQASGTVSFDNPLGLSDLAYISYSKSLGGGDGPSPKGSQAVNLHYSVPWGYWLYSLNASAYGYHQTVVGAYDNYRYSGQGNNLDASVARVLWRDQQNITTAHASLLRRASSNDIDGTEILVQRRVVTSAELGISHRYYWGPAILTGGWDYRQGISGLGALAAPEEAFGEGTAKYRLSLFNLGLRTPFRLGEQQLVASSSVKLQVHHTRLTPQDRFSIGGRYSVRGFDASASLTGDSGLLWRNDLTWQAPWMGRNALYLGLDMGRVSGPSAANLPGATLVGMVVGLRGAWQTMGYDLFAGRPLSKPNALQGASSAFGFALNRSF
jgi:hemolysin activation/secretion protein